MEEQVVWPICRQAGMGKCALGARRGRVPLQPKFLGSQQCVVEQRSPHNGPRGSGPGFHPDSPFLRPLQDAYQPGRRMGPFLCLGVTAVRGKQTVRSALLASLQCPSPQGILTMLYTSQLVSKWISFPGFPFVKLFILCICVSNRIVQPSSLIMRQVCIHRPDTQFSFMPLR